MIAESHEPCHTTHPHRKNTQQNNFHQSSQHAQHRTQYPGYYMTMEYNPKQELRKSQRFRRKNQPLLKQALLNVAQTLGLIFDTHSFQASSELIEHLQEERQNQKTSSHQEHAHKINILTNLTQHSKQNPNPSQ